MPGFIIRKATQADAEALYEMRLLLQRHSEEVNRSSKLTRLGNS